MQINKIKCKRKNLSKIDIIISLFVILFHENISYLSIAVEFSEIALLNRYIPLNFREIYIQKQYNKALKIEFDYSCLEPHVK